MAQETMVQRLPAEQMFQKEINALIKAEQDPIPTGWKMSPKSVLTYITGGKAGRTVITPKYIGHKRLVEIAIATLVTDRALLLIGEPGTAKSWLSEHLSAAINGDSTKVIQGTAGTTEEQIRYSWNYAMLIAQGRFSAADISFTPLSLVFAVAITENPFCAGTSNPSSGTEIRFSDKMEISASCTSEAHLEISSNLAMVPVSMAW